ncbi:symmetrical bis(5'-nucleosyl)-tetraphosphatase [Paraferrimonas sedimenticola]|uniref:bis(5'-nucleosyl)-tetraphosphatase (symmetrical) n=1 Tax=Paraferrimonas sedimenticola TaxID=375674 RepID=A0AA37W1F2_9GAMM|nr:symmetrical bis(5'-nucleosyl)-tetraphosphatase [Paraferrimonas sedimenticola]GLP97345.1 bis(5'-nucleosyl)-tetraphosphatase, symmetrical [Paraferrimonas sedimenticola]
MANYYVGDIQGCFDELERLLAKVEFNPSKDNLWASGDLVARGPDSLKTLRYFEKHQGAVHTVLGNHDLHLLAVVAKLKRAKPSDQLEPLLQAKDAPKLIDWLRRQPLIIRDKQQKLALTHAGIPPQWRIKDAQNQAAEVQQVLASPDYLSLIRAMYGNEPARFNPKDTEINRWRYTINALTRMRFLTPKGDLEFEHKLATASDSMLIPWFKFPRKPRGSRLLFGHWAALQGKTDREDILALDTGCVWGNELTLWHSESNQFIRQASLKSSRKIITSR